MAGSPPAEPSLFLELAKLQEDRGAVSAAEKTLQSLCRARPDNAEPLLALAALYRRTNYIDQALDTLERAAAINRLDPNAQHMLAADYWDASRAQGVSRGTKARYLLRGISAENRALAIWPDFAEALAYKSELLREEASLENGATQATILLAQADALRTRVLALGRPRFRPPPLPRCAHRITQFMLGGTLPLHSRFATCDLNTLRWLVVQGFTERSAWKYGLTNEAMSQTHGSYTRFRCWTKLRWMQFANGNLDLL